MTRLSLACLLLTPTYSSISNVDIMFDLCPLSQKHNWGIRRGLPVHHFDKPCDHDVRML